MTAATARRALLGITAVCLGVAGAMLLHAAPGPKTAFHPPPEDICIVTPARLALAHAWDPASGLGKHDARPIPVDARCPVCGMYPARFALWAAQLVFEDGSAHFFDSPVDLFMFLDDPGRFEQARSVADVTALYVADHDSGSWLDAHAATFVLGSNARGPMRGPDLPAFADRTAATRFIAEHGGNALVFAAIDRKVVASLRDANHAAHMH